MSDNELQSKLSNLGKRWSIDEESQLTQEYKNNISIREIAIVHKRTTSGIKKRLIRLGLIDIGDNISKKGEKENSGQVQNKTIRQTRNDMAISYEKDMKEIKNDIKELKDSIHKLTEMLKAVYDFEDT